MRGIAYRRYQLQRRKKRMRSIIRIQWRRYDLADDPALIGIMANTPCRCSCPFCGNPRRHFHQKTRKELVQ